MLGLLMDGLGILRGGNIDVVYGVHDGLQNTEALLSRFISRRRESQRGQYKKRGDLHFESCCECGSMPLLVD
jgi:hypothetical protein